MRDRSANLVRPGMPGKSTPRIRIFWLTAAFLTLLPREGDAQTVQRANETTIYDGVYTHAQAERGARSARSHCLGCHSTTEWSGRQFLRKWSGQTIGAMYEYVRRTMPFDDPGNLSREQYADIVAYILGLNEAPPGDTLLPTDEKELESIWIVDRSR